MDATIGLGFGSSTVAVFVSVVCVDLPSCKAGIWGRVGEMRGFGLI